jgi:hypothetical protein
MGTHTITTVPALRSRYSAAFPRLAAPAMFIKVSGGLSVGAASSIIPSFGGGVRLEWRIRVAGWRLRAAGAAGKAEIQPNSAVFPGGCAAAT